MNATRHGLRLAIITDEEHPGLRPDDVGLTEAFAERGIEIVTVPWGREVSASEFQAALIRTPWDYFDDAERFVSWAEDLPVPVLNDAATLRWNHNKRYLLELAEAGAGRLPETRLLTAGEPTDTAELLGDLGCEAAVVKPVVSGGAFGTRVVRADAPLVWGASETGAYLAQSFVNEVVQEGEWSLTYFGGQLSHSVLKVPKAGDFRVQDDFGGAVRFEAAPESCVKAGGRVLEAALRCLGRAEPLTYARVDLVRQSDGDGGDGEPLLMELELIEPELFLRADPSSPGRLAEAVISALA